MVFTAAFLTAAQTNPVFVTIFSTKSMAYVYLCVKFTTFFSAGHWGRAEKKFTWEKGIAPALPPLINDRSLTINYASTALKMRS